MPGEQEQQEQQHGQQGQGIRVGLLAVAGLNMAVCTVVAELVNNVVDEPYLDESFHIPQAQRYCNGDYDSYDSKLTTPPGLYYLTVAYARITYDLKRLVPLGTKLDTAPCNSVPQLRYISSMALLLLPWLLSLYKQNRKGAKDSLTSSDFLTAEVHIISLLPPLWFFGFLYYTDVPSTVFVVACLLAAKKRRHLAASLLGCASLTLRQTNIVWVLFAVGTSLLTELHTLGLETSALKDSSFMHQIKSMGRLSWKEPTEKTLRLLLFYSPVAILSVAFVLWNGTIVLGDQENHQATLHWAQPLYCIAMMTAFGWPALLSSMRAALRSPSQLRHSLPSFVLLTAVCLASIHYGTIAHPFLLADNRHYTFYIWRRVIDRTWWSRYALAPVYAIMLRLWWAALARQVSVFWIAGFLWCTCAAIVPSPLIEPRYFLLPYLIARLHLFPDLDHVALLQNMHPQARMVASRQTRDGHLLALEAIWYAAINAVTMYLFLYRPFRWTDSTQWQRFMW